MMKVIVNPERGQWQKLALRTLPDDADIEGRVKEILTEVKNGGDEALKKIILQVEGFIPKRLQVTETEFDEAERMVDDGLKMAISRAAENITSFHNAQKVENVDLETIQGVRCVRKSFPIESVGLYIPGGSAPLFSTLLMLAIPAKIAGCKNIVLCTPCDKSGNVVPAVLYAARFCGIETVFKIGGAQAIAAMSYGTQTVTKVLKIFGPGNRYVTKAKQMVSSQGVAIDMPAGPSEVMVLADGTADVSFVAADLLSQAEHGADSQAVLVCDDASIAEKVNQEIGRQLPSLSRKAIAQKALSHSMMVVLENRDAMFEFANCYAPEHLILSLDDPWKAAEKVIAAGSVFLGNYSPESAGDYASGTNHTLPTMGLAAAYSGLGVESFMHSITYQKLEKRGLESLADTIITMAEAEGLDAHAAAVKLRML